MRKNKLMLAMNGGSPYTKWLNLFAPSGDDVGLFSYQKTSSGAYFPGAAYEMGNNNYVMIPLPFVGDVFHAKSALSKDNEDASVTYSGTWSLVSGTNTYGGFYRRSNTANDYVQFTCPSGTIDIGIYRYTGTNLGLQKVTIDGDATLANRLYTAQDVVDLGWFPNTILVANGGTLNPTDRVMDQYLSPGGWQYQTIHQFIAWGLAPGAHVVRFTVTPYTRGTDTRCTFSGYTYATATTRCDTATATLHIAGTITNADSRWEFAHAYVPTGGSTPEWIGHTGSYTVTATTYTVDGTPVTPSGVGNELWGGSMVVIQTTMDLIHSESVPRVGEAIITYTFDQNGMSVRHQITWEVGGTYQGYSAMLPCSKSAAGTVGFVRGRNVMYNFGQALTLTNNNNSEVGNARSKLAMLWHQTGYYGLSAYIADVEESLQSWRNCSTRFVWLQDRNDGLINKIYFNRSDTGSTAIAVNEVWYSTCLYRIQYFPGGAEAALA